VLAARLPHGGPSAAARWAVGRRFFGAQPRSDAIYSSGECRFAFPLTALPCPLRSEAMAFTRRMPWHRNDAEARAIGDRHSPRA